MGFSLKLFSRRFLLICICIGEYQCRNVEIRGSDSARNGYFSKDKRSGYLDRFRHYMQSRASNITEKLNTLDNRTLELQEEIEKLWAENELLWEKLQLIEQSLSDDQPEGIESVIPGYSDEPLEETTESPKPESQHGPGASYLEPAEAAWPAWPIKKKY